MQIKNPIHLIPVTQAHVDKLAETRAWMLNSEVCIAIGKEPTTSVRVHVGARLHHLGLFMRIINWSGKTHRVWCVSPSIALDWTADQIRAELQAHAQRATTTAGPSAQ